MLQKKQIQYRLLALQKKNLCCKTSSTLELIEKNSKFNTNKNIITLEKIVAKFTVKNIKINLFI